MQNKINSLVKGKKELWNHQFDSKVCGRPTQLGGIGKHALTLKLKSSKKYPNLDIKGFLNWSTYDKWTDEEKQLAQELCDKLGL